LQRKQAAQQPVKEPSVKQRQTFIRGVLELGHKILATLNQAERVNRQETDLQDRFQQEDPLAPIPGQ